VPGIGLRTQRGVSHILLRSSAPHACSTGAMTGITEVVILKGKASEAADHAEDCNVLEAFFVWGAVVY
jgi:hypothetical protein